MEYILGIDQSTQGTKAVLVDSHGNMIGRADFAHKQIINEKGWVSHDLEEIYTNVLKAARAVVEQTGINKEEIRAVGISNQRETTAIWNKDGKALNHAIVWQCSRAAEMMKKVQPYSDEIRTVTGIPLSPFFPAAKMAWLLNYTEGIAEIPEEDIRLGTMDSWLIYRLTGGKEFKTDYSNASRTQLFDIRNLCWSEKICSYGEYISGVRCDGFLSAFVSVANKAGGALMPAVGAAVLAAMNYVANTDQTPQILNAINWFVTLIPAIISTINGFLYLMYPISTEKHKEIMEELIQRR